MIEITVVIKQEDASFRKKFLHYQDEGEIALKKDDKFIALYVDKAMNDLNIKKDNIESVILKTEMVLS